MVYLPFGFDRSASEQRHRLVFPDDSEVVPAHRRQGRPGFTAAQRQSRGEDASDDSRLTYVALTRAQAQVVAWWSPADGEPNGGLSRLLRGRSLGEPVGTRPV